MSRAGLTFWTLRSSSFVAMSSDKSALRRRLQGSDQNTDNMNQAPGQGMVGQPNGQNIQAPGGVPNRPTGAPGAPPANVPLYRPEQMQQIHILTAEEKAKYTQGLAQLWKIHDNSPPGSQEQMTAKSKIAEFGRMLTTKVNTRRLQAQQANVHQVNQAQQIQHQQQHQQMQQRAAQQAQLQAQQQLQQQQQQLQQQNGQAQASQGGTGPPGVQGAGGMAGGGQGQAPAGAQPGQVAGGANRPPQQQARAMPGYIASHINELQFNAPANVADKAKWLENVKAQYARALYQVDNSRNNIRALTDALAKPGLAPNDAEQIKKKKETYEKMHQEGLTVATTIRKQYITPKPGSGTLPNGIPGAPGGGPAAGQVGAGVGGAAVTAAPGGPMQPATAAVSAAFEAAKKQQLAAGRMAGAVNTNQAPQQQAPSQPQHPHQTQAQTPATPVQTQSTPISQAPPTQVPLSQSQSHPPTQAPIKVEPGTQPTPVPAPLNTALAAARGMPSAGTPTQNSARIQTPQSATPTANINNPNIQPLTHAAAVSAAAVNSASQSRPGSIAGPPTAATPASGPPPSASIAAGSQGHPHAHPPQQIQTQSAALNATKFAIPKTLHDQAAQMPKPAPHIGGIGSGRPTLSGGGGTAGGVLNQPVLPKTPAYQIEGEGERILNKKKLDELVRQVCGGTAEGQDGNMLTPDVEESVLNLADAFVDNVLHTACRNAKERGSKVLEIRDLQLVLERTYNIRIPGYSSEELRTVRKMQPNNSWIKKMSAVQAAKVVPGKGDL
ncbi:hypothetical protein QBC36DRAFT_344517 [Triangularia setosa]|uniref:Transcription initiation factor TFIID subunit 12 domain-containing protein n=1 Tax=Triangularia setosa TaxID=2587417 RepID=A0AAN6WDK6_9PEZI|nr:hypothetical protein QBC36DRAFT_344517 [Podospora setosa]